MDAMDELDHDAINSATRLRRGFRARIPVAKVLGRRRPEKYGDVITGLPQKVGSPVECW